ncbi:MAG: YihY/virulence factor BrkB family protein, partial [Muribaculaceae bacterium]|nr:YihY/virulence factor BrkB family protein [Muribaculaceae bacterium]
MAKPETPGRKAPEKPAARKLPLVDKAKALYDYVSAGVWSDTRSGWKVNTVKTVNLSVRSFFNSDLQNRACGLTYQTLLAIVPALALLFAIARGFGFQNLVQSQLLTSFPAQRKALETALSFVDSYLATSSEGIFVGVGIVFLLWTLISLLSNVEDAFNQIWGVGRGRSLWRKITDYTAIFLILPVLMICASGITVFMSTTIQNATPLRFLSPLFSVMLDLASLVLVWLFFAGTYMLIPNAKVKIGNAILAGVLAGTGFLVLQWLFVSGQVYVMRYNAIYGSFAFLPLLLIWLQLVWLITLSGAVLCYSSQNIVQFAFSNQIDRISDSYQTEIDLAVLTIAVSRFSGGEPPLDELSISKSYGIPIPLVSAAARKLTGCGLLQRVVREPGDEVTALAPATDPSALTLGDAIRTIRAHGTS